MFRKLRKQIKFWVVIIAITFVGGLLYIGGTSFFGGGEQPAPPPVVRTVGSVNGVQIDAQDFQENFFMQLQQIEQQQGQRIERTMFDAVRYQTFEGMVSDILINQEIQNRNIAPDPELVEEFLQEIIASFPSVEDYQQQLALVGLTEAELRGFLERDAQFETLRRQLTADITVSEDDILRKYEEVEASHILIRPEDSSDEESWTEAEAKATKVLAEVMADGADFAALAETYSDDPGSAAQGGSLGFFSRGRMVPEFEEAAFGMDIGEISDLVRSNFGYHIILVTDRKGADDDGFAEAKESIEENLRNTKENQILNEWFTKLRQDAAVEINDYQIQAFSYFVDRDFDNALAYYEKAMEQNPNDPYIQVAVAQVKGDMGDQEGAIAALETAIEAIGDQADVLMMLGEAYRRAGEDDQAVQVYMRASEANPLDFMLQLNVYSMLSGMDRPEELAIVEERLDTAQEMQAQMFSGPGVDIPEGVDMELLEELDLDLDFEVEGDEHLDEELVENSDS